jgi:hypothetical protein
MKNTGMTLVDVRHEAFEAIQKLKDGRMEISTARAIREMLDVVIDTAKTQVEFMKSLPNSVKEQLNPESVKAIAGTLRDRDAELDESLTLIERNRNTWQADVKLKAMHSL